MSDWTTKLVAAALYDRAVRAKLASEGVLFEGYHPEMEAAHLQAADLLESAFDAIGWPGPAKVGDDGAAAAILILQHAISRPDLQRRGLELMLDAIPEGQANPIDAAYLADRIAVFEGRGQIFGTQFDWDAAGQLSPAPVNEPEALDARRASVGLPPLADTLAEMRAGAAADGETAPADHAARRAGFEAWARRVGWRG